MSGNKREQRDRECGLTFSWRTPESSKWSTCAAVVIVGLLTTGFLGAVRVRIMPPPRIIERHASIVVVPESAEGRSWAVSVEEQGPFPSKFNVSADPGFRAVEKSLQVQDDLRGQYRPQLRELPQESTAPSVAVSLRGERFFPREPVVPEVKATAPVKPLLPTLLPLSSMPESAMPGKFPGFEGEIPAVMAAKPWRFMVEIGPNGRILQHQPIEAADDDPTKDVFIRRLDDWVGRVQFGPTAKPGWIGVEVTFNRAP